MKPAKARRRDRAFTLIELMVVVGIIGTLASIAIPALTTFTSKARRTERDMMMKTIEMAIKDWTSNHDQFPNTFGGGFSYVLGNWNPFNPGGT